MESGEFVLGSGDLALMAARHRQTRGSRIASIGIGCSVFRNNRFRKIETLARVILP